MMSVMLLAAAAAFGQDKEVRMQLKGTAYAVGTQGAAGLEIDGKLVLPKNYKSFQTDGDGILFAVEANDGKYGVVDRKGTWIYKPTYYKAQITGDMIRLQAAADSQPKFYKVTSPTTEVVATRLDPNTFNPDIRKGHEQAEAAAREIAAQDAFATFSFKTNERGEQSLYVDGEKLFTAWTWELISDYELYKETDCFIFIVMDKVNGRRAEGVFVLEIGKDKDTGKKVINPILTIPIEYSHIVPAPNSSNTVVRCTTFSGATKSFTATGKRIEGK